MPKRRYRLNLFSIINETFGSSKQFVFSTFLRNPYFRRPAKFGKPKGVVFDENEVERYKLDLHLNFLFRKVTDWNQTLLVKFDYLVVKFILEPQRKRSVNFRKSCGGGRSWRRDWREREKKTVKKKENQFVKKKNLFFCAFLDLALDQNVYLNYLLFKFINIFLHVTYLLKPAWCVFSWFQSAMTTMDASCMAQFKVT